MLNSRHLRRFERRGSVPEMMSCSPSMLDAIARGSVWLNGFQLSRAVAWDTRAGWVEVLDMRPQTVELVKLEGARRFTDPWPTVRLYGSVRVRFSPPVPPNDPRARVPSSPMTWPEVRLGLESHIPGTGPAASAPRAMLIPPGASLERLAVAGLRRLSPDQQEWATRGLLEHPPGWDGPCACNECAAQGA